MSKHIPAIFISCVAVVLGILVNNTFTGSKKIAFVRSQELVYQYEGMREAQALFEQKKRQLQAELDTLQLDFDKGLANYRKNYASLSEKERKGYQNLLDVQRQNLIKHSQTISERINEEEAEMLEGVLNQVNAYAKAYGIEHGYDILFGTTRSGSILYGKDALDLTEVLIEAINKQYKPK